MKRLMAIAAVAALALGASMAQETKYDAGNQDGIGTNTADIVFGPAIGRQVVEFVAASTDREDGSLKFYARSSAWGGKSAVTTAPAASATSILIRNTATNIASGDTVVYVYSTGVAEKHAVTGGTLTNITIDALAGGAGSTSDYVYELSQQGQILVGLDGAAVGTNDTFSASGAVFASPGDSPLWIVVNGTSNTCVQATVR